MSHSHKSLLAGAMGLALLATAMSAPAATAPSKVVRYDDLDLSSARGAQMLYRRIERAAEQVCPQRDAADLQSWSRARRCQSEAITRAVQTVHNAQLAALHAARAKQS